MCVRLCEWARVREYGRWCVSVGEGVWARMCEFGRGCVSVWARVRECVGDVRVRVVEGE